jgi:hypothetical protein
VALDERRAEAVLRDVRRVCSMARQQVSEMLADRRDPPPLLTDLARQVKKAPELHRGRTSLDRE